MKLKDFHTREAANEGIKIPLFAPDGKETEEYIIVRGFDSDEFQKKKLEIDRVQAVTDDLSKRIDNHRKLIASLVMDWSFEDECSPDAVEQWLNDAPQVQSVIENIVSDRQLFFSLRQASLSSGSESRQSSTKSRKTQSRRTGKSTSQS